MRRFSCPSALALSVLGVACSSLIGIEEIHEGPDPAAAGADGGHSSGNGGTQSAGKAGAGNGGRAGTAGGAGASSGGTSGGTGGSASGGKGGKSGQGGGAGTGPVSGAGGEIPEGGMPGDAGAGGGAPDDPTVHGRVVSYFLQPIENVHVMIGDLSADTDENGEFAIPDVADTYDLKLVVTYARNDFPASYGWVYEGLTRRRPTLQVYGGLDDRSGNILIVPNNAVVNDSRSLVVALGGPYGSTQHEVSSAAGVQTSSWWNGPETSSSTAHGLLWGINGDGLPTSYFSYATTPALLAETAEASITLDMPDGTVTSGAVSGTVTSPTEEARENKVFVRFTSNAVIELAWHYGDTLDVNAFSYTVPTLTNGTITVSATEGDSYFGEAAVAHRDGLSAGQSGIALVIPKPSVLTAPTNDDTGIDHDTIFSWTGDAETFVWHAEDEDLSNWGGLYVVTTRKQLTIPTFPNGFELAGGHVHSWRVETHGEATSVDELTGSEGFSDSFGASKGSEPTGPRRGSSGQFTISTARVFTPAP